MSVRRHPVLYVRALGARIGKGMMASSRDVPLCAELLTVGDSSAIRKDCGTPGRRMIPEPGMSMRPALLDESYVDEVVRAGEADTVRACRRLAGVPLRRPHRHGGERRGRPAGPAGVRDLTAVAAAPDLGERYPDTVYQDNWVRDPYGRSPLDAARPGAPLQAPGPPRPEGA
ncbi:hypothetical protein [Streptomyces sp. NPDC088730]|uniref:hypothetical protein n=1 Tax=Streptomyces sp. NPDC088730 TaxID=3365877 RepID=UPI0037FFFC0A